jgi:hypothetical protein
MASEFLPGRNLACLLLFHAGRLIKLGCYERLVYFMGHTALSGVTGNIAQGRLINDPPRWRCRCRPSNGCAR